MELIVAVLLLAISFTHATSDIKAQRKDTVFPTRYCGIEPGDVHTTAIPPLDNDAARIIQAQIFIRHGDRTVASPGMCWPNDNTIFTCETGQFSSPDYTTKSHPVQRVYRQTFISGDEPSPGNCGVGQLTSTGYWQQFTNGEILRNAYVTIGSQMKLLPLNLSVGDVYLRSDDNHRTVQSGEALFLGLYPPAPGPQVEVVPFYWVDPTTEIIYPNPDLCPGLLTINAQAANSTAWLEHYETVTAPLIAEIAEILGIAPQQFNVNLFEDCMEVYNCHNLPLPKGFTAELFAQVESEIYYYNNFLYLYPDHTTATQLSTGILLSPILSNMQAMVDGEVPTPKFFLYSGHDTGPVLNLLAALNVSTGYWSPYAALISLELYTLSEVSYGVRLIYNGQVLPFPWCPSMSTSPSASAYLCDFDSFTSYVSNLLPSGQQCIPPNSIGFTLSPSASRQSVMEQALHELDARQALARQRLMQRFALPSAPRTTEEEARQFLEAFIQSRSR